MAKKKIKSVDIITAIDGQLKKVHTHSLDLSFNELLDMKKSGELDISPDYQRLFQWTEGAQSRFIESLLLEMPVPPIYVIEEENGRYLLIDGLQRISSYLHFRGELEAPHLDRPVKLNDKLTLIDCDIVKELNGHSFETLSIALQIKLKRAFVRVEVVRKGSDARFKYHMFKRLNTGGKSLTEQQLRNCTIRLLDPLFNDFIIELSKMQNFRKSIEILNTERTLEAYDQELVLRFFALKNNRNNFTHDVGDFLTEYMEEVSDPDSQTTFDYSKERAIFEKTFAVFANALGDLSFGFANKKGTDITKGFGVYHFEAFTIGLQKSLSRIVLSNSKQINIIASEMKKIKLDKKFIRMTTGGGKNSKGPLKERIEFVEKWLSKKI